MGVRSGLGGTKWGAEWFRSAELGFGVVSECLIRVRSGFGVPNLGSEGFRCA